MSYQEILENHSIAISTSDSDDMLVLGLTTDHLRDAMAEIARHMLALGAKLIYGGDLRSYGFSELLFELSARYRRDTLNDSQVGIVNYLAWPVHISKQADDLAKIASDLAGTAELKLLNLDGTELDFKVRHDLPAVSATEPQWAEGLSAMRRTMLSKSQARIVLGGRTEGYKGSMPGIAEESLCSLQTKQPLFIMGGFGGCARDIAETMELVPPLKKERNDWEGRTEFARFSARDLNNGLSKAENDVLATTPHVDQALILILRGLLKSVGFSGRPNVH